MFRNKNHETNKTKKSQNEENHKMKHRESQSDCRLQLLTTSTFDSQREQKEQSVRSQG